MPGETDHIASLLGIQAPAADDDYGNDNMDDIPDGDGGEAVDEPSGAPAAEAPADATAPTKRGQKVPLAALQEERTRRQEAQDRLTQRDAAYAQLEQRTNILLQQFQLQQQQAQQQQAPAAPEIPAFAEDPEGHINALRAQVQSELDQIRQYQAQQQQAAQGQQQNHQAAGWAAQQEQVFLATNPDYNDAANFFHARKQAEYAALGADPVAIQQQVQRDYMGIVQMAHQRGGNPAELLYNLSKAMGYAKAAAPVAGKPAAPAAPVKAPPTSLSNMGGSAATPGEDGELTVEKLNQMSDADFDKMWKNMAKGSGQFPKF